MRKRHETWREVADIVLRGRRTREWQEVYPTVEAWMADVARKHGFGPSTVRRWASAQEFSLASADRQGWPDLSSLSFSATELIARLARQNSARARDVAHQTARDQLSLIALRKIVEEESRARQDDAGAWWSALVAQIDGLDSLTEHVWPPELPLGAPDMLLSDGERTVALVLLRKQDLRFNEKVCWTGLATFYCDAIWWVIEPGVEDPWDVLMKAYDPFRGPTINIGVVTLSKTGEPRVRRSPARLPERPGSTMLRTLLANPGRRHHGLTRITRRRVPR